jgi:hypothetical protein
VVAQAGRPLEEAVRADMERRYEFDFRRVRVHADGRAGESAVALGAAAYTVGQHVVFGPGRYRPQGAAGRALLAHELAHVVQYGPVGAPAGRLTVAPLGDAAERRAGAAADAVLRSTRVGRLPPVAAGTILRSPLSDELTALADAPKGRVFDLLRRRGPAPGDADALGVIGARFAAGTDDRWLAENLLTHGPEPRWPHALIAERATLATGHGWEPEAGNIEAAFATGRTPVRAFFFPGRTARRAMIVGGIHGKEGAGVQIVELLLDILRTPGPDGKPRMPAFGVIVVPELFPENVAARRRSTPRQRDPNRQMPRVGEEVGARRDTSGRPLSAVGEPIEPENLVLLDLVDRFRPERIAMVHGVQGDPSLAGITTDPRSVEPWLSPGGPPQVQVAMAEFGLAQEAADRALALDMARSAAAGGARVPGNRLTSRTPTTTYPTSSRPHQAGVTFGMYGSRAAGPRPAMNVILIEPRRNDRIEDVRGSARRRREVELTAFATVLREIFLESP